MEIDKQTLIERFLAEGDIDKAERADRDLPDRIDPAVHADTLRALGMDAGLLQTQSANLEDQYRDR